ncbi:MAG: hypothetical protein QOG01_4257, partial [Pseudonocardiales bacterium]|nr:hypothetical protein [Pseudonocardiales bacterium]
MFLTSHVRPRTLLAAGGTALAVTAAVWLVPTGGSAGAAPTPSSTSASSSSTTA